MRASARPPVLPSKERGVLPPRSLSWSYGAGLAPVDAIADALEYDRSERIGAICFARHGVPALRFPLWLLRPARGGGGDRLLDLGAGRLRHEGAADAGDEQDHLDPDHPLHAFSRRAPLRPDPPARAHPRNRTLRASWGWRAQPSS